MHKYIKLSENLFREYIGMYDYLTIYLGNAQASENLFRKGINI